MSRRPPPSLLLPSDKPNQLQSHIELSMINCLVEVSVYNADPGPGAASIAPIYLTRDEARQFHAWLGQYLGTFTSP